MGTARRCAAAVSEVLLALLLLLLDVAVADHQHLDDRVEEGVQKGRVKVCAATFRHDRERALDCHRRAVDAVAGQRVEDVCDRCHAALDRDLFADEAVGVAVAVPVLVVAERDARGKVKQGGVRAGEDLVADLGVLFDLQALFGGQRAGLQQNRVGDRDLADVVQRGGDAQQLALADRSNRACDASSAQ